MGAKKKAESPFEIRDRIKELRRVKASELLPNPKNWRKHPAKQAAVLRGVLREVGYADALLVRETAEGLILIDGHLRAETTPDQLVPVLILDVDEAEAAKILATLDPLAGMAEMDKDALRNLTEFFQTDSGDIRELLESLSGRPLGGKLQDPEPQVDKAAELQAKWGTEAGQGWQIGPHRLICGDCRLPAVVRRLWAGSERKIRLVWTDPPYGVDYSSKNEALNATDRGSRVQRPIENDALTPEDTGALFTEALAACIPFAEPGASIYATVPGGPLLPYFISAMNASGFICRWSLVWIKQQFVIGRGDYHMRHEPILYGWIENGPHYFSEDRTQDSVFEVDKPHVSDLHPTTKPVELIARMIANSSRPGELVYDPFSGSGSTLLAAHQLGRVGYGVELYPGYVAVILERLSSLGLKPELLSSDSVSTSAEGGAAQ